MQNEVASGQPPVFSSVRTEAGKARVRAAVAGFQSRPGQVQPSIPEKIAAVKARYDARSITPQDIDQMFDALVQAGQPVTAPMLLLNSMGEKFRGHLAGITGGAFDGAKPVDLLSVAQLQIQRARKQGGSSAGWETFLAFLAPPQPHPQPNALAQPQHQAPASSHTALEHVARLAQQAQARPH
ncbi:hypothetical protein RA19_12775 [Leisingera sp. ANG-M1]|uniref:hypothetical protein n=1 Tax=Leisingera sp. ANG-M1 TaxID=1577895 RepID=UPI00057E9C0A|nr:hypothetical protein [Leisingera sp. ANG-M1]KIC10028.1 hypothetical protein RA19_12775 [Leisingera sp. ANG-M1]